MKNNKFTNEIIVPETSSLQQAIDNAPDHSVLILPEITYSEHIMITKPLKLVGAGSGGSVGAYLKCYFGPFTRKCENGE